MQPAMAELDAMWARMQLPEAGAAAPPAKPVDDAPAPPAIVPPRAGASKEEVKAYRAAVRKAAVDNVRKARAEADSAAQAVLRRASGGAAR